MNRFVLGGLVALFLAGIGMFWWESKAEVERAAPPARAAAVPVGPLTLPSANPGTARGPALPEASEQSREQKRFSRLDKDRDGRISRVEMLAARAAAFRKLDKDGNNLLTFEEWAVKTVDKFNTADANHDLWLSPDEFRTTAPKPRKAKPKCICAPAKPRGGMATGDDAPGEDSES